MQNDIQKAADLVATSKHCIVFTGAGISVESGIPPFRGPDGLWSKYDPTCLELDFFNSHPQESWEKIYTIFYEFMGNAKPNAAHIKLAELEEKGIIKSIITQNIDNLHQDAGSKHVLEFHGTTKRFECQNCLVKSRQPDVNLKVLPPSCPICGGLLKPDFIFFGEMIPSHVNDESFIQAELADVVLVIGTTGEVMPACYIPYQAKETGSTIIEINAAPSAFTNTITDIFLKGKATEILTQLFNLIK